MTAATRSTITDLVGPLIRFHDGTSVAYHVPGNTCDPRYSRCQIHHPACDCREAEANEVRDEYRAVIREIQETVRVVLRDHATWAFTQDGEWDFERRCQCTGCQIARTGSLRPMHEQIEDGVPCYRPTGWEAPR